MDGDHMEAKIARRHQVTIPEEICELAKISIGDTVEISCKHLDARKGMRFSLDTNVIISHFQGR
jgi:bifunctional DNA-binding transcriptional regulator/antitoxin component of YhaV-PrlF toxin-antitoxin module